MNEAQVIDIARDSIWVMILVAGPILLVGLAVGLAISLFQTLTQLQEMTLTFVPKIIAVFVAMIVLMPYMLRQMSDFTIRVMDAMTAL